MNIKKIAAIALSATLAATLTCHTLPTYAKDDTTELTVATFNIDAKSSPNVKKQSKLMAKNGVEIVGVQEVDNNTIRNDYNMAKNLHRTHTNLITIQTLLDSKAENMELPQFQNIN